MKEQKEKFIDVCTETRMNSLRIRIGKEGIRIYEYTIFPNEHLESYSKHQKLILQMTEVEFTKLSQKIKKAIDGREKMKIKFKEQLN